MIKAKQTKLPDNIIIPEHTPYPNFQQTVHKSYCKYCGRYITLYDTHHAENFCIHCGNVEQKYTYDVNSVPYGSYEYEKPYTGSGYTTNEKNYFKHTHRRVPRTYKSSKERKHIEYRYIIDEFKKDLCLDNVDIEDIFIIINKCNGMNSICVATPASTILVGIARYLLIHKGIRGYLINFNNRIYKKYGLTRKNYDIMVNNIEAKTRLYRCNR